MEKLKHISFEDFKKAEVTHKDGNKTLYYGRLYGQKDWGFVIKGFNNIVLKNGDKPANYIEAWFLTHDLVVHGNGAVMPSSERKQMLLKGITKKNFNACLKWIEEQREVLLNSFKNPGNGYNTVLDLFVDNVSVDSVGE